MSKIEWTEKTWNPIVGCSIVSPGCTNCYAMRMAARLESMGREGYRGATREVNGNHVWTGQLSLIENRLSEPLLRKKPTTYFVNSMSDLFHESIPDEWIDKVFAVMALTPQHTYQVLTKRAERMRDYVTKAGGSAYDGVWRAQFDVKPAYGHPAYFWPLENVWLGVSAERQQEADERIPPLLETPAAVRFVSAEPLLGPLDLRQHLGIAVNHDDLRGLLNWIICGGESGPGARPMHPQWARDLRDNCAAAGIPFFFKQWGAWCDTHPDWPRAESFALADDGTLYKASDLAYPDGARYGEAIRKRHDKAHLTSMYRLGKKAAGRTLDGKIHDAMPGAMQREAM